MTKQNRAGFLVLATLLVVNLCVMIIRPQCNTRHAVVVQDATGVWDISGSHWSPGWAAFFVLKDVGGVITGRIEGEHGPNHTVKTYPVSGMRIKSSIEIKWSEPMNTPEGLKSHDWTLRGALDGDGEMSGAYDAKFDIRADLLATMAQYNVRGWDSSGLWMARRK